MPKFKIISILKVPTNPNSTREIALGDKPKTEMTINYNKLLQAMQEFQNTQNIINMPDRKSQTIEPQEAFPNLTQTVDSMPFPDLEQNPLQEIVDKSSDLKPEDNNPKEDAYITLQKIEEGLGIMLTMVQQARLHTNEPEQVKKVA